MAAIRQVIRLLFLSAFLALFGESILKFFAGKLGTSITVEYDTALLPTAITICPFDYQPIVKPVTALGKISLSDLDELPSIKDEVKVILLGAESYDKEGNSSQVLTLNNATEVSEKLKIDTKEAEELWQEFLWIYPDRPFCFRKCATIKMPIIHDRKIIITVSAKKIDKAMIEFRNLGESNMNYELRYDFLKMTKVVPGHLELLNLRPEKHAVNKNCDENLKRFDCIQEYIIGRIKCKSPAMLGSYGQENLPNCTDEDLSRFSNIYMDVLGGKADEGLRNMGCLARRCEDNNWKTETLVEGKGVLNENLAKDGSNFMISIHNNQTMVTQEYTLYSITNFIAESGGNLGLLLGASLLSLMESCIDKFAKN